MKQVVWVALAALSLVGCQQAPKGYVIKGEVTDLPDGKIYLKSFRNKMFFDVDTAEIKEGKFTFEGSVEQPLLYGLAIESMSYPVQFFIENVDMEVKIENEGETITVQHSPVNEIFRGNAEKVFEPGFDIDSLVSNYPDSPAAAFYLYRYFTYQLPLDDLKATRAKLSPALASNPYVADLDGIIKQLENVQIGKTAPEFSLPDTAGVSVALSDFRGKYVLLDFWASWCPPCRKETPHLVELYKQYKNKGFEIIGISLDSKADAWEKGVKDLNITWPQLSDLKGWQNAGAALYGVNSIPHTLLVDKDGTIIAKNIHGEEIDAQLQEALKK